MHRLSLTPVLMLFTTLHTRSALHTYGTPGAYECRRTDLSSEGVRDTCEHVLVSHTRSATLGIFQSASQLQMGSDVPTLYST